jgi:hypothetical protein
MVPGESGNFSHHGPDRGTRPMRILDHCQTNADKGMWLRNPSKKAQPLAVHLPDALAVRLKPVQIADKRAFIAAEIVKSLHQMLKPGAAACPRVPIAIMQAICCLHPIVTSFARYSGRNGPRLSISESRNSWSTPAINALWIVAI